MVFRIKKFIGKWIPPPSWRPAVIVLAGIFCGLGFFVLYISNALSYASDEPATCMNCHIMAPQYATWQRSSHFNRATCNDCHVPQDNILRKYLFKAQDGLRHATVFTLRNEPQVIRIKDAGKEAVQQNCIRCHGDFMENLTVSGMNRQSHTERLNRRCVDCHQETPHGRVNSLASTPYARVPRLSPVVPEWIKNLTRTEHK